MKTRKHKLTLAVQQLQATKRHKSEVQQLPAGAEFKGLSHEEVFHARAKFGLNEVVTKKKAHPILKLLSYFQNPLIILLLVASVISGLLGEVRSSVVIITMVLFSVILNFYQEYKSSKEIERLQEKISLSSQVVRQGVLQEIPAKEIVPNDIIMLSAGDIVPADGVVMQAQDFFINESVLTGESFPVEKHAKLNGKLNASEIAYAGSNVISGSAFIRITAIGSTTKFGQIALSIKKPSLPSSFEKGVTDFGYLIVKSTVAIVIAVIFFSLLKPVIFHTGISKDWIIDTFLFAVAIAVGLTPELLPMIMSLNMAKGSLRMAEKGVIVKRLNAIPDFGSIEILCTDKTGTLTEGVVTLIKYLDVSGNTSEEVLRLAYFNSSFQTGLKNPLDKAILDYKKFSSAGYEKIDEIPYDFFRKRMSIVVKSKSHDLIICKGQPEEVLKICSSYQHNGRTLSLSKKEIEEFSKLYHQMSGQGYRVLALAIKERTPLHKNYTSKEEEEMALIGLVAFYDPPKKTAAKTLRDLYNYGVEVKIITGDNELVTQKVCQELGLKIKGIMIGTEIDNMTIEDLGIKAEQATIFARFSPIQKNQLIIALRTRKHVVGYLGDGINDAPSLKSADVGISVNNAVDVAKETADIILMKKSLRQLTDGIIEGRKIFGNTMKYLLMGISSNFGNMFSMLFAVIYLPFLPMLSYQILLNNSLYDLSQTTIPSDDVDIEYLQQPKQWDFNFVKKFMIIFGTISSIFDILTFIFLYQVLHLNEHALQTGWFIESLATQTLVVFIIRTRKIPFVQSRPSVLLFLSTTLVVAAAAIIPYTIGQYFDFTPLPLSVLFIIAGIVAIYLVMVELVKQQFYKMVSKENIYQ